MRARDFSIFVAEIEITQTVNHYDSCQEFVESSNIPNKKLTIRILANTNCGHLVEAHLRNSFNDCDLSIKSITEESIDRMIIVT